MSESGDIDIVDLTGSPSSKGDKPAAKKLKQLRLPFAPIQKNADKAEPVKADDKAIKADDKPVKPDEEDVETGKKRKHSEEAEEPNKKPALEEGKFVHIFLDSFQH
jgi:hypothetical protein